MDGRRKSAKKIGVGRDARKKREDRVGSRRKWERYIVLRDILQHKETSTAEKEAESGSRRTKSRKVRFPVSPNS